MSKCGYSFTVNSNWIRCISAEVVCVINKIIAFFSFMTKSPFDLPNNLDFFQEKHDFICHALKLKIN